MNKLISYICLLALSSTLYASNSYDVKWEYLDGQKPLRVNIDLSLDNRTSWMHLGLGVPSHDGTNVFSYSLPDKAAYLSDHAYIRVMEMPRFGKPRCKVDTQIHIVGIKFIDAPATVTNGAPVTLSWVAAGAGEFVQLSYLSISASEWQSVAVFGSVDSDQGATTNSAVWNVAGLPAVPTLVMLRSMERPMCHRGVVVEVNN